MDRMLRRSWSADSSYAKYTHRSPRAQVARARSAATLVFPAPAVPEVSTVLPRKYPAPPSISSRPRMPEGAFASERAPRLPGRLARLREPAGAGLEGIRSVLASAAACVENTRFRP